MILFVGGECDWNRSCAVRVPVSPCVFSASALHVTIVGGEDSRGTPAFRSEDACKYVPGVQDALRFLRVVSVTVNSDIQRSSPQTPPLPITLLHVTQ